MEEKPYIKKRVTRTVRLWNKNYDQNKLCICGHPYHRHFDGFEPPEEQAVGCKYCQCYTFKPKE